MRGAGPLSGQGSRNQRLPSMPHQLHHQRHTLLPGGDIQQINSGKPRPRRCGIDAHELGEYDVGPDMLDEIGA